LLEQHLLAVVVAQAQHHLFLVLQFNTLVAVAVHPHKLVAVLLRD
jgi:hypothetical protein